MAYRNSTYVAFAGCGTTNPTESDIKYYNLMKGWKGCENINFSFNNSHDKTSSVKDNSSTETLKRRLKERLNESKNILVFISKNTKSNFSEILDFEITTAVNLGLPMILCYCPSESIKDHKLLPDRINFLCRDYKEIYEIIFAREPVLLAINTNSIHN